MNNNDFITIMESMDIWGPMLGLSQLINSLSFIPNFVKNKVCYYFNKSHIAVADIVNKYVDESIATLSVNNNDYINNVINGSSSRSKTVAQEMHEVYKSNSNYNNFITLDMLKSDILILITSATNTTSIAMESSLTFAAKYSNLQEEIYSELLKHSRKLKDNNQQLELKLQFNLNEYVQCVKFRAFLNEVLTLTHPVY